MNDEQETTRKDSPMAAFLLAVGVLVLTAGVVFGYYSFFRTTSTLTTISPTLDF